jgi:hypothetical protein
MRCDYEVFLNRMINFELRKYIMYLYLVESCAFNAFEDKNDGRGGVGEEPNHTTARKLGPL